MNIEHTFRVTFRAEGDFVNAYYAQADTMKGALLLGSMRRAVMDRTPGIFDAWCNLFHDVMKRACADTFGVEPQSVRVSQVPGREGVS